MKGVSGCLAGLKCRYNGSAKPIEDIINMVNAGQAVPFCPEFMAGLSIPRAPCEITGGDGYGVLSGKARVVSATGEDRTDEFMDAAKKALQFCRDTGINEVLLKSKSPSCGLSEIYDGTFTGRLREGAGVTAALLKQNGIKITEID